MCKNVKRSNLFVNFPGIANAARGDRKRRTRKLPTPHVGIANAARGVFCTLGKQCCAACSGRAMPAIIPSPAKCQAYRKEEQKKNR